MPKGSEELTHARKEEIIDACAALYETMGFRDITIRDIGAKTSFTRTSIYNYFQTKEEIFLALLQREHERWIADLDELARRDGPMSAGEFADGMARTLEKRGCMLKLMCMNLYDMEGNSRLENLVAFKLAYAGALRAVSCCLEKAFPSMTADEVQTFLYALSLIHISAVMVSSTVNTVPSVVFARASAMVLADLLLHQQAGEDVLQDGLVGAAGITEVVTPGVGNLEVAQPHGAAHIDSARAYGLGG